MNKNALFTLEGLGGSVTLVGFVFWLVTPGDVIVPPIIVIVIGFVLLGLGVAKKRSEERASLNDLVQKAQRTSESETEVKGQEGHE